MLKDSYYHRTCSQTWCKKWNAKKGEGEMSSVKQRLGFPHLHPAAQHSRHEDCTPTSVWRLGPLFYILLAPFPSSYRPLLCSEPQEETLGVTWAACINATASASSATHSSCRASAPQDASTWPWPGHEHLPLLPKVVRAWLRHGARCQIRGRSSMHTIPGGVLCLPNAVSCSRNVNVSFGADCPILYVL